MSAEAIQNFRDFMNKNPKVQKQLAPHLAPVFNRYHVIQIGKEHGFEFTDSELEAFYAEAQATRATADLSDFELEMVAAGTSPSSIGPTTFSGSSGS